MTQFEKLVKKFISSPESCRFGDIDAILKHYGFIRLEAKGSHVKYKHSSLDINYVVPIHNAECKDFYKKEIKKIISKLNK